jgi:Uma2 family endonuclease
MLEDMQFPDELRGEPYRPLSVDEVDRLIEAGAFDDSDDRVELLHGALVIVMADGDKHIWVTQRLMERLVRTTLDLSVSVICQSSAKMSNYDLPSPDICVVPTPPPTHDYKRRLVGGLLVAEVANSSLRRDVKVKPKIYATAGVPEYWVIDVNKEHVLVHTEPEDGVYCRVEIVPRDGTLRPRALPGVEVSIEALFAGL